MKHLKNFNRHFPKWIVMFVMLTFLTVPVSAIAQFSTCSVAGNVEVDIKPRNAKSNQTITFNFVNHNPYQVTVNATINLVDVDGKQKSRGEILVIEGNKNKEVTYNSYNLNMSNFMIYDCGVELNVAKCE